MRWRTCSIRSGPRPSLASQAWPITAISAPRAATLNSTPPYFVLGADFGVAITLVYPGISDGNNPPGGLLEPVLTSRMVANGPLTPTDGRGMSSVLLNQISTFESTEMSGAPVPQRICPAAAACISLRTV